MEMRMISNQISGQGIMVPDRVIEWDDTTYTISRVSDAPEPYRAYPRLSTINLMYWDDEWYRKPTFTDIESLKAFKDEQACSMLLIDENLLLTDPDCFGDGDFEEFCDGEIIGAAYFTYPMLRQYFNMRDGDLYLGKFSTGRSILWREALDWVSCMKRDVYRVDTIKNGELIHTEIIYRSLNWIEVDIVSQLNRRSYIHLL